MLFTLAVSIMQLTAKVVPHVANFFSRFAPNVAIARKNYRRLVHRELVELQGRLNEKCNRAVEEVRPDLLLERIEEFVFDDLSEVAQTLQDHRVLVHNHIEPVGWEHRFRHQLFEDQQDFGEKVLQIEPSVEVINVHLVMRLCHVSEDSEHNGN